MADWSDKIIVIGIGDVDTDAIKDAIVDKIKKDA